MSGPKLRRRCVKDITAQDRFSARHAAALIATDAHLDEKVEGDLRQEFDFELLIEGRPFRTFEIPLHLRGK